MVDILIHLHQYIPSIEFKKTIKVGTREPFEMKDAVSSRDRLSLVHRFYVLRFSLVVINSLLPESEELSGLDQTVW